MKYLDSKRIRGSSANPATPLHDIDFTEYANQSAGEAAWISSSTSGSNGYMIYDHTNKNLDCRNQGSSAGAKICYYDLGASVNATDWRIRFRYSSSSFSAESTGGKSYYTGFSISNAYDTADTGSPDWFGLKFIADAGSAQSQFYGTDGGSQSGTTMSFSPTSNSGVNDVFVEWHFVSGTCTCKFFTDSDYDTQISGSATVTKSTSVAGLRYFMVYLRQDNGGNGDNEFVVDDFEFINGTESTDEKATLVTAAAVTTHYLGHNEDNMAQNGVMGVAVNSGSSLIGKEITKVSFWARYINGATNGTLYCRAWDSSGNVPSTVAKNFGSIDGSTLTSSMAKYTFTIDSGTYTIAQNSHIGLEYSGSANNVEILGQNSGGAYGTWFEYDGSYSGSNGTKTPNIEVTESATSNLPENTLFEETDTRSVYFLQSGEWVAAAYVGAYQAITCGGAGSNEVPFNTTIISSGAAGGAWTTAANMPDAIWNFGSGMGDAGRSTFMVFGGHNATGGDGGELDDSYKFNGTTWSSNIDMPHNHNGCANGGGSSAGALAAGGRSGGMINGVSIYNGSSWSDNGDMNTMVMNIGGDGDNSDFLRVGGRGSGNGQNPTSDQSSVESYDGSSWSSESAIGTAIAYHAYFGNSSDGISLGGAYNYTKTDDVSTYNGSSWSTSASDLPIATSLLSGASNNTSASTNCITWGGFVASGTSPTTKSYLYNGTSWTEKNNLTYGGQGMAAGVKGL